MGNNLLKKSTNKYIICQQNLDYLESQLLDYSGLKRDEIL
jgi:hypothetical protein